MSAALPWSGKAVTVGARVTSPCTGSPVVMKAITVVPRRPEFASATWWQKVVRRPDSAAPEVGGYEGNVSGCADLAR